MKRLRLVRDLPTTTETRGILAVGKKTLYTIERPWVPTKPGGKPFESCVPAGDYRLWAHVRPNGETVLALINPGLAVYYLDTDRPGPVGRYLILIHSANWADQVNGCIAPGIGRGLNNRGPMVTRSRDAMRVIMDYIGDDEEAAISIIGENTYA